MKTASVLIEALSYIKQFRGEVFVVKLGGEVMDDPEVIESVALDLMLLNVAGIHTAVVHGGGKRISETMHKKKLKPRFVDGLRATDGETLKVVEDVLRKVREEIAEKIKRHRGKPYPLSGKREGLITAKQKDEKLGRVGAITEVNPEKLKQKIEDGFIPVISPIAKDVDGGALNINADTAASRLAAALKASKFIILTNVRGVRDKENQRIKQIPAKKVAALERDGTISGGMIPKVNACVHALKSGVNRAHIVKAGKHALLVEILTKEGTGTMVLP